jgi:chemotaxis methyl-accepting protein methylase
MKERNRPIIKLLLRTLGYDISKYNETFLEKTLQNRITERNCDSEEVYCTLLEQNENEGVQFSDSLHINYSEFFRNSLTFSVLEKVILPTILSKRLNSTHKEIRIWSAACAAGQETYSLAMLLKEIKNSEGEKINFRIFATDYSETQVKKAFKGQYSPEELNNLTLKQINQCFTKHGNVYSVKPELKENIDYSVFDLFSKELSSPPSSIFGDFDIVVCANLLFYYKPEYQKSILAKVSKCLAKGGYLITGETEREIIMQNNFEEAFPQSAIFMKKQD